MKNVYGKLRLWIAAAAPFCVGGALALADPATPPVDVRCPLPGAGTHDPPPGCKPCTTPMPAGKLDIQAIQSWLASNPVTNMDDLVSCLPREYRSNYTLIYDSKSPHGKCGGVTAPRIVFFNQEANSIISIPGNKPDIPPGTSDADRDKIMHDCNDVEMFSYNEATASYTTGEVAFQPPGTPQTAGVPTTNPQKCTACHTSDFHPKWDRYPSWPGTFGSNDDVLKAGSPELAKYQQYQAEIKKPGAAGRYKCFLNPEGTDTPPYLHQTDPNKPANVFNTAARPNLRLSSNLSRQADQQMERQMRSLPDFQRGKYRAAAQLLGCGNYPLTDQQQKDLDARADTVAKRMQKELNARLCREAKNLGASDSNAYCSAGESCAGTLGHPIDPVAGKSAVCYLKTSPYYGPSGTPPDAYASSYPSAVATARSLIVMEGLGLQTGNLGFGTDGSQPGEASMDIFNHMGSRLGTAMARDISKESAGVAAQVKPDPKCYNQQPDPNQTGTVYKAGSSKACIYGPMECVQIPDQTGQANSDICNAIKQADTNTGYAANGRPCPAAARGSIAAPPPPPQNLSADQVIANKCMLCHGPDKGALHHFSDSASLSAMIKGEPGLLKTFRDDISTGGMPMTGSLSDSEKQMMLAVPGN
jgi:hypothetical protein